MSEQIVPVSTTYEAMQNPAGEVSFVTVTEEGQPDQITMSYTPPPAP